MEPTAVTTSARPRATKSNPNNFERRMDAISRVFQEVTEQRRISQQQVTKPFKEATQAMVQKMTAARAAQQAEASGGADASGGAEAPSAAVAASTNATGARLEFFYMCPETLWSNIEASHGIFQIDAGKCARCQQELVSWRYCNECKSLHAGIMFENSSNSCHKKVLRDECARKLRSLDRSDLRRTETVARLVKLRDEKVAKYKTDNARWLWRHNASPNARGTLLVGHSTPTGASRKRKKTAGGALGAVPQLHPPPGYQHPPLSQLHPPPGYQHPPLSQLHMATMPTKRPRQTASQAMAPQQSDGDVLADAASLFLALEKARSTGLSAQRPAPLSTSAPPPPPPPPPPIPTSRALQHETTS